MWLNQYLENFNKKQNLSDKFKQSSDSVLKYTHIVDMDLFFPDGTRVSVPVDKKRRGRVASTAIRKRSLGSLDVVCPDFCLDIRFGAKEEIPVVEIPEGKCNSIRVKDRISYELEWCSVDLSKIDCFSQSNIVTLNSSFDSSDSFRRIISQKVLPRRYCMSWKLNSS